MAAAGILNFSNQAAILDKHSIVLQRSFIEAVVLLAWGISCNKQESPLGFPPIILEVQNVMQLNAPVPLVTDLSLASWQSFFSSNLNVVYFVLVSAIKSGQREYTQLLLQWLRKKGRNAPKTGF